MQICEIGYQSLLLQDDAFRCPDGLDGSLLLLLSGAAKLQIGSKIVHAESGDAAIISPHTPLQLHASAGDLFYDWVLFQPAADRNYIEALHIPENTLLRFGDAAFLAVLLRQLCASFYSAGAKRSDMLDCLLKALLIRISETGGPVGSTTAASSDPHYAELLRLREKIYANPQEKWTVDMLCSEVCMSRSYFQLIYRETFGMTCIADVITCKMNRARELLTSTSYTISHIAQLCGYDNEEHFMRQFKKNNGVTPTVFRREHRV